MTVEQLAGICNLEIMQGGEALKKTVTGGYCGDLLSWVMGRAFAGSAWITVMGNENAVAVAVLAEVACIILAQGATLDGQAALRADENNVAVLKNDKGAFDIAANVAGALAGTLKQ
jgi:predicted transcriptional regulator